MRRLLLLVLLVPLGACRATSHAESAGSPLAHGVFFTLADPANADARVFDHAGGVGEGGE